MYEDGESKKPRGDGDGGADADSGIEDGCAGDCGGKGGGEGGGCSNEMEGASSSRMRYSLCNGRGVFEALGNGAECRSPMRVDDGIVVGKDGDDCVVQPKAGVEDDACVEKEATGDCSSSGRSSRSAAAH